MLLRELVKSNFFSEYELEISKASASLYMSKVTKLDIDFANKYYDKAGINKNIHLFTFTWYFSGLRKMVNELETIPGKYMFYRYKNLAFVIHTDIDEIQKMEGLQLATSGLMPIHRAVVENKHGIKFYVMLYDILFNFDTRIVIN